MKDKLISSPWAMIIIFLVTTIVMTSYEYLKELLFEGTLTPWQSHTITIIVTATIATITALVMRSWVLSLRAKEKEIEAREISMVSFSLIVRAVNHIVNNFMNHLQLIRVDYNNNKAISEETLKLLEESLSEVDRQMKLLNKIDNPQRPESYKGIFPE